MTQNKAAVLTELKKIEIRNIEMPDIKDNEVLVKIEYVGICGSDVHFFEVGRIGDLIANPPFILGHESAGVITKVGPLVKDIEVGDKVAIEPGIPCGSCDYCKNGKYNLCPDVIFLAAPPYEGSLKNYLAFPSDMVFKLPENLTTLEGALIEPLAVGLHAAKIGEVSIGDNVLILGSGTIGLTTMLACKAMGASKICIVDILENRLSYAKKLGVSETINAEEDNVIERTKSITNGQGFDKVIEAAGSEKTIEQTPYLVKRGGKIILVGMAIADSIGYDLMHLIFKEVEIRTVFRYRNIYPLAINAVATGGIDIKNIVTHTFSLDETNKAFSFVLNNPQEVIKAVIKMG